MNLASAWYCTGAMTNERNNMGTIYLVCKYIKACPISCTRWRSCLYWKWMALPISHTTRSSHATQQKPHSHNPTVLVHYAKHVECVSCCCVKYIIIINDVNRLSRCSVRIQHFHCILSINFCPFVSTLPASSNGRLLQNVLTVSATHEMWPFQHSLCCPIRLLKHSFAINGPASIHSSIFWHLVSNSEFYFLLLNDLLHPRFNLLFQ